MKTPGALLTALLAFCFMTACGAGGNAPYTSTTKANPNIAFMGDSITNRWSLPTTNFGIYGNTTAQMRARFAGDVLGRGYKAVVILGGTNDLLHIVEPTNQVIAQAAINLQAMAAAAEAENIQVVLCEIPPIDNINDHVESLNQAIVALAEAHKYLVVDYYTPMAGHPEYFLDGVHPNDEGYAVMKAAFSKVLSIDY
jgi:lysophospholipase L1-like esterase